MDLASIELLAFVLGPSVFPTVPRVRQYRLRNLELQMKKFPHYATTDDRLIASTIEAVQATKQI